MRPTGILSLMAMVIIDTAMLTISIVRWVLQKIGRGNAERRIKRHIRERTGEMRPARPRSF